MSHIKIDLPDIFYFTCTVPVRITDLNYGGHVGNDAILSIIHEARMQYLGHIGFTELQFAGSGLIMADVAIEFKSELFYGDIVHVSVSTGEVSKIGFALFYRLEKTQEEKKVLVAAAKTGMLCFDYAKKKIVSIPEEARLKLI